MQPRVLLFSQRNTFPNFLYRCPHREFEDVISHIDAAEILAPQVGRYFNERYRIAKRLAWHSPFLLNPGLPKIKLQEKYDLFFTICGTPVDLLLVNTISNLKEAAKFSVCLIDELWARQLPNYKWYFKLLAKFDLVLVYYSQTVKPLSEAIGRKCMFLPPGVDSILFCPQPRMPARHVDVYSIGRRAEITHHQLLNLARQKGIYYSHDSIMGDRAVNSCEHRVLLAETAKRSRYFIVNPGLIDRPAVRGDQIEIGNRYFEGAAAGCIMIGEHPSNEVFRELFDWPGAVIDLPYNSGDIGQVIAGLDENPETQKRIRQANVTNSLMRHDWVYRWAEVLRLAGLEPMPGLLKRKEQLQELAKLNQLVSAAIS